MNLQPSRWYERSHALVTRKLGACPRCMRASLGVAIGAWAIYGVARTVSEAPLVHAVALVVAGGFTALFLAHVAAFYVRVARPWRAGTLGDGIQGQSRRRFFVTSGALLGGVLLAPLSRVFSVPVLAKSSPPAPCECGAPNPKAPKANCPSCRCKTNAPPKKPTLTCKKNVNEGATTTTTADGNCVGTLAACGSGGCTRTFTWTCQAAGKSGSGFNWEKTGETDSCPTAGAPPSQVTTSQGKCRGKGCNPQDADCGKQTTWTCDPHAGEGNDRNGRWTGTPVDNPPCPV
jgi:hypothetical protein